MNSEGMTPGERALAVAVLVLVGALFCIRTIGQWLAGLWLGLHRWRHHRRHGRRPR